MSNHKPLYRHPVYARDSLLGWISVWDEIIGAKWVEGRLELAPDCGVIGAVCEEVVRLAERLSANADGPESDEGAELDRRYDELMAQVNELDITIGESRMLIESVGL